jgi:spore coat protein H
MHGPLARPLFLAALVLLSACAGGGGDITYPAVGTVDGSEDEVVFEPGQVLSYHVTMEQADRDYMEAHGVGEEWVPASVTVTGDGKTTDLGQVGFRHKGGVGNLEACWGPPTIDEDGNPAVETHAEMLSRPRLDEPWCRKISYKFKFNQYAKETRLHGLKKLNLHSGSRDPTMLHDMLAYSLFWEFGVDAPRTSPARLFINGDFMGLFIAVEDVDDRYAKYHFPGADGGNLYKEVWPSPDTLAAQGAEGFADLAADHQDEGDDPTDFVQLTQAMAAAVEAGSVEPLAPWVDVDALLRYMAVDRAIKNWDGVTAMYTCEAGDCGLWPHNFYWYHDTAEASLCHLVPWDMDNTFQYWDPYMDPHGYGAERPVPDWNVKPASCAPIRVWESSWVIPPGCDPVLHLLASTQWSRYEALGRELIGGPLRASALRRKAQRWSSLIEPIIREDPVIDYDTWQTERDILLDDILVRMPVEFGAKLDEGYIEEE